MNKGLACALEKMPGSKMIYINPGDECLIEGLPDSIRVKKSPLIQRGSFLLSEKDLEEELKKAIEDTKINYK